VSDAFFFAVKKYLENKTPGDPEEFVFKGNKGKKITAISVTFERTVKDLGLNKGIKDRRMKVVFHTLRHTYASWMVQSGVDLYKVKELLGHSTISQTERYAHLSKDSLREAVKEFENMAVGNLVQ
jgi:site-specific recombinase XerD